MSAITAVASPPVQFQAPAAPAPRVDSDGDHDHSPPATTPTTNPSRPLDVVA